MPRKPKPYFRKQTKSWYCSINGKQIPLGKDRETADQKFHELMADKEPHEGALAPSMSLNASAPERSTSDDHLHWSAKLGHNDDGIYVKFE